MFFRILKKDLKRKRTMNIILLIFVILSVMFSASSVNNMVTVFNGSSYYFEKAGMSDYYIIAMEPDGTDVMSETLKKESCVTDFRKESAITATSENFFRNGKVLLDFNNAVSIMPVDGAKINYFDSDNQIIDTVEQGKAYLSGYLPREANLNPGDTFEVKIGETKLTLEFIGSHKNITFDPKLLINQADYERLCQDSAAKEALSGIYYINSNDIGALEKAAVNFSNVSYSISAELVNTYYFMDMLVAGMLLIVGICLILVSFVALRFTIGFTISEEFREIGIMKALGLRNSSIRGLYLVKYLGIAVIGAVIGYFSSIPFGKILLASVSENMVLGNDSTVLIGILCSLAAVAVILMFCWRCTAKIKKLSPVDAVRSGQTGERFRKKSMMHLGSSKLGTTGFLALNDVLSSPKQYGIITAVFTICLLLVMILANTANTVKSEQVLYLFGVTESEVYYLGDTTSVLKVMNGQMTYEEVLDQIEKKLKDNNMPGNAFVEELYQLPISHGDEEFILTFQICKETKASDYPYTAGTPPMREDEIALASPAAERLGVKIGDTVTLTINGEKRKCIVTALFQSLYNLGEIGRLHESVTVPNNESYGALPYQINFDDHPDSAEIAGRVEKLKDIFDDEQVYDVKEYCKDASGIVEIVNGVKYLVLAISIIIIIMISVLMELSFISKEKSEIALMKATGFSSRSVIAHHSARFCVVAVIASLIGVILCFPLTKLTIDPVFAMMGVENGGISYKIEPFEVFAVYPLVILAVTLAGAFLTSLYTKTIKASDTASIE